MIGPRNGFLLSWNICILLLEKRQQWFFLCRRIMKVYKIYICMLCLLSVPAVWQGRVCMWVIKACPVLIYFLVRTVRMCSDIVIFDPSILNNYNRKCMCIILLYTYLLYGDFLLLVFTLFMHACLFIFSGNNEKNPKIALAILCNLLPKKGTDSIMKCIYQKCKVSILFPLCVCMHDKPSL